MLEDLNHGIGEVLPVRVGFQEMDRDKVRAILPHGHADGGGGDRVLPLSLTEHRLGPVPGEIVIPAGADEPGDLFGRKVPFDPAQA